MATYGREHNPVILEDIELLREQIIRDIFDHHQSPTRIVSLSISGSIDPFTEEITSFESNTYYNISGVIGSIGQEDILLGLNGRVEVGDLSIVYPYNVISGLFLNEDLNRVEVLQTAISGVYYVAGYMIETFGNIPIYVKVALKRDNND